MTIKIVLDFQKNITRFLTITETYDLADFFKEISRIILMITYMFLKIL